MATFSYIDEKYIKQLSMYVNRFREVGNGTYNCRCSICGDSAKSVIKARGYFYQSETGKWRYKCHNCSVNISLGEFLKTISQSLYDEYRFEYFTENGGKVKSKKEVVVPIEKSYSEIKKIESKEESITARIINSIKRLSDLPDDNEGVKYIISRSIPKENMEKLFYTENLQEVVKYIPEYKDGKIQKMAGIIIPYFSDSGILENFQIRNIDQKSNMRYLTYDIVESPTHIFNLENINSTDPVYVFEGAFDSMFCHNGVAASGSSIFQKLSKIKEKNENIIIVFDNDYKTNPEIFKLLSDVIEKNYSVVLFDNDMQGYKDINKFAQEKNKSKEEITEYLKKCTYSEMAAKMVLANQKKNRGSIAWVSKSLNSTQSKNQKKTNEKLQYPGKRKNSVFTI